MKIERLRLENFRLFKSFDYEFHPNLSLLVGLNGQGKSSVLDAIAIAFGPFAAAIVGA